MIASRASIVLVLAGILPAPAARAEEAAPEAPSFETQAADFERRIAELAAVDPLQPEALEARLDYARLLHEEAKADCAQHLEAAERQLQPLLGAERAQLIAYADGKGDALSLLQSIQNTRGQCAQDDAASRAAFESAIATGQRAVEALRENWDYEEMAIAQFNIAYARRGLGDLEGALQSLNQVIAWDLEYGLHTELEGDYSTLLRWQTGEEADPAAVQRFVDSYNQPRARFRFDWKPHRSRRTSLNERAVQRAGALRESRTRIESETTVSREGEDWVLSSTARSPPQVETSGIPLSPDAMQGVLAGIAAALPEVVIAGDGTFKELRNLDRLREALDREFDRLFERLRPAGKPAVDPKLLAPAKAAVLDPDLLTAHFSGQWNVEVEAWLDGEFDHGDWYEATFEEPLAGFSEKPIELTWAFKVARWLPCADGGEPRCVELLLRITPNPDKMRLALADFVARMLPAAGGERLEQAMREVDYRIEMRYRLVTEPDTLRPWSYEERNYVYAATLDGGKRDVNAQYERTLETIRYLD